MSSSPEEIVAAVHERVGRVATVAPPASLMALTSVCPALDVVDDEDNAVQTLWSELAGLPAAAPVALRRHAER